MVPKFKGGLAMSDSWEIAAWRFEMISPLLDETLSRAQKRRILRQRTKEGVQWPCSEGHGEAAVEKPIGRSTLLRWLHTYRNEGFVGLVPKTRKDKGLPRDDRSVYVDYALGLLYEQPERSLTQLMLYLQLEFPQLPLSRSTLSRDLHAHPAFQGILRRRKGTDRTLRDLYETDKPHRIWQLDAKGPFAVAFTNGQTRRLHVLSILDDFSRTILAAIIAPSEDISAAVRVFRLAASKWGMAERIQFDRASAYDSKAFRTGLALLGVHRNWVKPRNPRAQGKIEAYHRALIRWFLNELPKQEVVDLEHLEDLLQATIDMLYNQHRHRELKMTPAQALAQRISPRRVSAEDLLRAFRLPIVAKSHPTTGQVALPTGVFRVSSRYAGRKCTFRYDPLDKHEAFLVVDANHLIPLEPFAKKRPFEHQRVSEKRGTGQLQKLLDLWRGHARPNAQPGFGLPEVFRQIAWLLERPVPLDEREAHLIETFYRKTGPLPGQPLREAIEKTRHALGPNRPLKTYLDHLDRLIRAQKNKPHSEDHP
jgi:transposase InsO family protein